MQWNATQSEAFFRWSPDNTGSNQEGLKALPEFYFLHHGLKTLQEVQAIIGPTLFFLSLMHQCQVSQKKEKKKNGGKRSKKTKRDKLKINGKMIDLTVSAISSESKQCDYCLTSTCYRSYNTFLLFLLLTVNYFLKDLNNTKNISYIYPCNFHFQGPSFFCVHTYFHLVSFSSCLKDLTLIFLIVQVY